MKRYEHQWQDFKWVDIEGANDAQISKLAEEFSLPLTELLASLDPEHLPKCEFFKDCVQVILRHHDPKQKAKAATILELTTKIILFAGKDFIVTIHRESNASIEAIKEKANLDKLTLESLIKNICIYTIRSFEPSLDKLDAKTDVIEGRVFSLQRKSILREGYIIKRRTSSYKKIFKFSMDVFLKLSTHMNISGREMAQVMEPADKLIFYTDSINEEISALLNLHISLLAQKTNEASYRANEVMRVLTVVSIFFLPLNFIAGVYGMNFTNMPELQSPYGYYITLGMMIFIVLMISYWVYRRGWMKNDNP